MSVNGRNQATVVQDMWLDLGERLRARQSEIESAIFAGVRSVSEPARSADAEYEAGLRATVAAVLEYSLTCIERGEDWVEPVPSAAIAQARRAARAGVSVETLVLRYIAGHRLLGDFVMDEADHSNPSSLRCAVRHLRWTEEVVLERLTASLVDEYKQELKRMGRSPGQRRREIVQRLLAGEAVDVGEFGYDFDAWHLGAIATGVGAAKVIQGVSDGLGRQLLDVECGEGTVWAWLGGQSRLTAADLKRVLAANESADVSLAVGEPGQGLDGWRITHLQAQEALLVALQSPQPLTRYADVLLLVPMLQNELLARSLKDIFLAPLGSSHNGGHVLRQTLRALFETGYSVKAAAAKLEVDRSTVRKRRFTIEQLLGRPLHTCRAELEVALRLEEMQEPRQQRGLTRRAQATASSGHLEGAFAPH